MYPPVVFTGLHGRAIGNGFSAAIGEAGYQIWACSILPKHVHMVVARHERNISQIVAHLKAKANARMVEADLHPFQRQYQPDGTRVSPWTRRPWKVFLNSHEDIMRSIKYVRGNPVKEGLPAQRWWFETEYPHYGRGTEGSAKADR